MTEFHIGRSWSGSRLEDDCPCPKAVCGLVIQSQTVAACEQHPIERAKSLRQIHGADRCPALPAKPTPKTTMTPEKQETPAMTIPTNSKIVTVTADMFDMPYDAEHTYPFFEDENGNGVYGYGHADKAAFATAVNEYDALCNGAELEDSYTEADVSHTWAVAYNPGDGPSDEWRFTRAVAVDTEGAFPMTSVSR